ncbi:MAG: CCA tRNA nucleotidyltransferase [Oligosphaeraceae bacterium]
MPEIVPQNVLDDLLHLVNPVPVSVVRELTRAGYEAYIVGGAVRDLLLGKAPKDYDISTSATPEEVRKVFGRRRCHVIGRRFRLAHVFAGGEIYEVSTFRRKPNEKERQGKRHEKGPIIWNDNCFGTLEEDALRRDFTANALYLDVSGTRGIIDFSGGYKDLRDGVVRCIGDPHQRMEEDPVRMLRAMKLVGQCGFRLEKELETVIRQKGEMIRLASSARLFEELLKILANPAAGQTLQTMHDMGFLKFFWPTVDESWEEQEGEMLRHLMKLRGDAMRRGRYSNSRGLALSTVALPFLMSALNPENPTEFWEGSAASEPVAHRALVLLFEDITVPRLLSHRILQIVGLVPRLMAPSVPLPYLNHCEYRYGRALVSLLVQLFGWNQEILTRLPELSPRYGLPEEEDMEQEEEMEEGQGARETPAPEGEVSPRRSPASTQGLPPELVPLRQGASRPVAPEEKSQDAGKRHVRKRHARKGRSPQAPENSPALHEDETEAGRDESPVVQDPPRPPAATFFNAAVKLPAETGRKGKKAVDFSPTDSITFGQAPQE